MLVFSRRQPGCPARQLMGVRISREIQTPFDEIQVAFARADPRSGREVLAASGSNLPLESLARTSGFCRRKPKKLTPALFAQAACLFVTLSAATFVPGRALIGVLGGGHLTKQALWERCTDRAAKFLQAILQNLLVTVAQQHGLGAPDALTFFGRVLLSDGPALAVSKVLARFFPRSRNPRGGQGERRKIQACYDLLAQQFVHFSLNPFRRNDPAAAADVLPLLRAGDLVIRGIQVESFCNANNDGLDIDRCCNRRVTDSRIWSGDDVFVFKSAHNRPCENVVIANCIASSHCNAFKLGIESYGGFMNITIANCVVIPKADGTSVPKADIVLWSRDFNGDGLEDAAGETAAEIDQTWYAAYDQTLAQNSIVAYTPALTVTYTNPGFALTLCRLHLARDCWRQIQCAFCGFAADHRRCFSLGMGRPRPPAASVSSPVGRRLAVQLSRR